MKFLNLLCYSLAVAMVAGGYINDHDVKEYRLATKRYHRKIRSSKEGEEFPSAADQSSFVQQPVEPLILQSSPSANEPIDSAAPNTSFLLELPYPSHFLVSLQMLNLSLPFLETGVAVPEDPPTPEFDLSKVIKNPQFQQRPTENQENVSPPSSVAQEDVGGSRRRAINRIRHRMPVRRLPKRSADAASTTSTTPIGKPVKFRNWNASNPASVHRRQEFANKLRSTTTPRPTFIKKFQSKLLDRRANGTKLNSGKASSRPSIESKNVNHPTALEQIGATTEKQDSFAANRPSGTSNRFVFQAPDYESPKTRIGGFRPIQPRPSLSPNRLGPSLGSFPSTLSREKFGRPGGFVPIVYPNDDTTTETVVIGYDFPPPSRLRFSSSTSTTSSPIQKSPRLSKYISQFHSASTFKNQKEDTGSSHQKIFDEEITQIQKPEIAASEANSKEVVPGSSTSNDLLVLATSTTVPATDFVPNPKYPSFELPSSDGSSTTSTLPPPLSIEELIKKFTGKDFVADPSSTIPTPTSPQQHPSPIQPKSISSTVATIKSTLSVPELESFDDVETTLKQLLVVTSASAQILNSSQPSTSVDAPTTSAPSSTTTSEPNFTLPVLPTPNWNPITEKTIFVQPETTTVHTVIIKEANKSSFLSGSEISKSSSLPPSNTNSTSLPEPSNQPVSVQRGPLDVSSFDGSFGSGVGQHQGGFNFQSSNFPQQQFQSNNFGGYPGSFGGGGHQGGGVGGDFGGQQNPYLYSGGLFAGSGGGQASFGGSGGGHQFGIQQAPSYQQPSGYQQAFNDFVHPSSLQASSQIQTTASFPSQGFSSYSQGYPSFNLVQQQPQSFAQPQPSYQVPQQPQSYPSQQQQQFYGPSQQQPYQLVSSNTGSGPGLYPVQVVQFQPQGVAYQPPGATATPSQSLPSDQATINPSQFGTLLSGLSSVDSSGPTPGTASITSLTSSTSGGDGSKSSGGDAGSSPAGKEKSVDAAASELVELRSNPVAHSIFADQETEASESVQLISIGPLIDRSDTNALKSGARRSLYNRGLRSGYYP
ncbi:hypothetical protein GHT06_011305 [Daphnia sinensis]|uniref:Uncharacterized protein n=1 Tax=Daphnia sinensis TaxID=1820382 RepID=A0AAD5LJE8_9CRUS|nr:hypothetical protein GHT06_011296 [Daphnia sinensis]KAI9563839.1 hypothetical protein GHT06_011305 [Daphnia sinensis]